MVNMFETKMPKNLPVVVAVFCLCSLALTDAACTTKTISSNNFAYLRETINGAIQVTSVTVKKQKSSSVCVLNYSYGSYGPDVWVDRGCRAEFRICFIRGNLVTASCSSNGFKEQRCAQPDTIRTLTVNSQMSNSPCVEGFSYQKDGNVLVVNKGCRASFFIGL